MHKTHLFVLLFALLKKICLSPFLEKFCSLCQRRFQITGNIAVGTDIIAQPVHKIIHLPGQCANHPVNAPVQLRYYHLQQNSDNNQHKQQRACHADASDQSLCFPFVLYLFLHHRQQMPFLKVHNRRDKISQNKSDGNRLQNHRHPIHDQRYPVKPVDKEEKRNTGCYNQKGSQPYRQIGPDIPVVFFIALFLFLLFQNKPPSCSACRLAAAWPSYYGSRRLS